ncbi:MAG: copper resistance protein NlpE [Oscillospiraceae bacterium]|nr:copper resistance protein NlpE [Oscillospiraceae bacterium]
MKIKLLLIAVLVLAVAISGCSPANTNPTPPPATPAPEQTEQPEPLPELEQSTPEYIADDEETEAAYHHHNARNSLDWAGTYQGIVPSASGMGIRVQISLSYVEGLGEVHSLTYEHLIGDMEMPEIGDGTWEEWSERIGYSSGTFEWDETGNIIRLDVNTWPPYYFVSEGRIIQLDMSGDPITGELADNYVLTKV